MKDASTTIITEDITDLIDSSRKKHIANVQYIDDDTTLKDIDDITSLSLKKQSINSGYLAFSFIPGSRNLDLSFLNKFQKYNPENDESEYRYLMKRGRRIIPRLGFQINEDSAIEQTQDATVPTDLYHTVTDATKINVTATSTTTIPDLPGITDTGEWDRGYDSKKAKYDYFKYGFTGYALFTPYELSKNSTKVLKSLTVTGNTPLVEIWARQGNYLETINENVFVYIGDSINGTVKLAVNSFKKRYVQIVALFYCPNFTDPDYIEWRIKYGYMNLAEYFDYGEYEADDPSFKVSHGTRDGNISCRDLIKKIYETEISLPEYVSQDICKVIRDILDRCKIVSNTTTIPNSGITISLDINNTYKEVRAEDALNECLTYLNAKNTASKIYTLIINDDSMAELIEKPYSLKTPDMQFDYRYNIDNLSRAYDSNNLVQRATASSGSVQVSSEELLVNAAVSTETTISHSWSGATPPGGYDTDAVNIRFDISGTNAERVNIEVVSQGLTFIRLKYTCDVAFSITINIYGTFLSSSRTEYISEKLNGYNALKQIGVTKKFENRFIQSDGEALDIAAMIEKVFGNPNWKFTITVAYNPFVELGDKVLAYEPNTSTQSILSVEEITYNFNADEAQVSMSLTLVDVGYNFENWNWDRNNVINGGLEEGIDDLIYDVGFIWDGDILPSITEDTENYDYLKQVEVGR